ncbi:Uncharacterised protein [Staphylococcus chromogenes]|nr:Uncharacterised protein [Staphylococcus chromogenes]
MNLVLAEVAKNIKTVVVNNKKGKECRNGTIRDKTSY